MSVSRAVWIVVLIPLITVPWFFPAGSMVAWWGVPVWTICSLAATVLLAVMIAGWTSRWWDRLADEAELLNGSPTSVQPPIQEKP
jgi:hypothetical protein